MLFIRRYNLFIVQLLLRVWVVLLINSVVFRHSHCPANGIITTHAQPCKSCATGLFQPNTHQQQQLYWFGSIANPLRPLFNRAVFLLLLFQSKQRHLIRYFYVTFTSFVAVKLWLRGPPRFGLIR